MWKFYKVVVSLNPKICLTHKWIDVIRAMKVMSQWISCLLLKIPNYIYSGIWICNNGVLAIQPR